MVLFLALAWEAKDPPGRLTFLRPDGCSAVDALLGPASDRPCKSKHLLAMGRPTVLCICRALSPYCLPSCAAVSPSKVCLQCCPVCCDASAWCKLAASFALPAAHTRLAIEAHNIAEHTTACERAVHSLDQGSGSVREVAGPGPCWVPALKGVPQTLSSPLPSLSAPLLQLRL